MRTQDKNGSHRRANRVGLAVCAAIAFAPLGVFCSEPADNEGVDGRPIWLVLTRPMFVDALDPLVEHRRSQGYGPVVSTQYIADALAGLDRSPACILLVGDHHCLAANAPWYLPTFRLPVLTWDIGDAPYCSTDWLFGDLDQDFEIDVPVGRIPVRRVEELRIVVRKIISYETRAPCVDDIRLPVWAGRPGYGPAIDGMATKLLLGTLLAKGAPWIEPWVLTADSRHPLSYVPWEGPRLFARQLARGGLIAAMFGHGDPDRFVSTKIGWGPLKRDIGYTTESVRTLLRVKDPGPPLFIFACECGDFSFHVPSLGEVCLLEPGGPVAVLGATAPTHPLMNYYSAVSLLELLNGDQRTIGAICMRMQAKAHERRNALLEYVAKKHGGTEIDMLELTWARHTHHMLYALLGDPATVVRLPRALKGADVIHRPGGWHWKALKPPNARSLYVGLRQAQQPFERSPMPFLLSPQWRTRFREANGRLAFCTVAVLSADEPWEGVIRDEGTLRFVVLTDSDSYVAVFNLRAVQGGPETSDAPLQHAE